MDLENGTHGNVYVSVRRLDRFWDKAKGYINTPRPIIVSNLTTDLEPFTKAGEYNVVFKHQPRPDRPDTIEIPFILLVNVYPNGDIIQVRLTPGGYIYRVKAHDNESWGEWSEQYTYASKDDIERIVKLAKKAIKTAKAAL